MITAELIDQMAKKCLLRDHDLDAALLDVRPKRIQTVNLHHFALAAKSDEFARTIQQADYITADGWPIVSLLRSRGIDPQRVTGSHLLERMVVGGQFEGKRAAILGAANDVGFEFGARMHDGGIHIAFREHGDREHWKPARIARRLGKDDVDLLIVAVTPPFGDMFGEDVRRAGFSGVVVNVGGAVNMVTGNARTAPKWVRTAKIEWLFRLAHEPRRLFRRYIIECVPVFFRHVLPQLVAVPTQERR